MQTKQVIEAYALINKSKLTGFHIRCNENKLI